MPSIIASPPTQDTRPPLPMRPTPHERDGRQPSPDTGRPHPRQISTPPTQPDSTILEALRRVVDHQIGPRVVGAIYRNTDAAFEVQAVIRNPEQARALLKRRCAQWALIVKDVLRPDAQPYAIGSVWTDSDYLVREADDIRAARKAVAA
ncbi:hypothetical protein QJ054_33005 [Streptomyces sp. AN-3]|uniref:hypothetical protein n=1 Tax=Streptomyces sp. AN-3 TaxID=3044177 RepID=UPI00249B7713|nr:hypothetical protein [Streptomyces sp. AN-3]MDI3101865.1 hypothetical protein [Streptomyces sp. AN-3]